MKKLWISAGAVTALLAVYIGALTLHQDIYSERLSDLLRSQGFEKPVIGSVSASRGGVTIEDVGLDEHDFSTIGHIRLPLSWRDRLTLQQIERLIIDDLMLVGEITGGARLKISGMNYRNLDFSALPQTILNKGQIDLYTPEGAIRLETKGRLEGAAQNSNRQLNARLWANQNQFRLDSSVTGQINSMKSWHIETIIKQAALKLDELQATRVSGWLHNTSDEQSNVPQVSGQLVAGKLTFGAVPLGNVRVTLEGPLHQARIIMTADVAGDEPLRVTGEIMPTAGGFEIAATAETASLDALLSFLGNLHTTTADHSLTANFITQLLLTEGNITRIRNDLKDVAYDKLVLEISGSSSDLTGKIIARQVVEGVAQRHVISLDPAAPSTDG